MEVLPHGSESLIGNAVRNKMIQDSRNPRFLSETGVNRTEDIIGFIQIISEHIMEVKLGH